MELTSRRDWERSKGDATYPPTSQNPPCWHPSWLSNGCSTRKDPESEWLARDNPETNPITIKPETASRMAEQFSWFPLPSCSPPGSPFPITFLASSACMSPRTIHLRVLDKRPLSGPGRGPPSGNSATGMPELPAGSGWVWDFTKTLSLVWLCPCPYPAILRGYLCDLAFTGQRKSQPQDTSSFSQVTSCWNNIVSSLTVIYPADLSLEARSRKEIGFPPVYL